MLNINIREQVKEIVKQQVKDEIDKGLTSFGVRGICPSDFIDVLCSLGFDVDESSTDFNGWECDYWMKAEKDGVKYEVSGGAWYGDSCIFLSDEQDEDEED